MRPDSDDPAIAAAAAVTRAHGVTAPAGAEEVAATAATDAVAAPAAPASAALASAVAAGSLDPAAAAERLIAATLASQRPADVDPTAWAAVEREVSALLAGDPALADLLSPL